MHAQLLLCFAEHPAPERSGRHSKHKSRSFPCAKMAPAVHSPFESHRQRMLDEAAGDVSTLLHCSWPPPCAAAAEPATLSRAAAPYPHGSLLVSGGRAAAACSEMLEARRLARAAKLAASEPRGVVAERVVSSATSQLALSSDDTLDLLIDAILASEVDSDEGETSW